MDGGVAVETLRHDHQESIEPVEYVASGGPVESASSSSASYDHLRDDGSDVVQSIIAEHLDALGDDDIEWVECDEEQEDSSSLGLFWRILLAMIAITLVAAFFYVLEKRRRKQTTPNGRAVGEDTKSSHVPHYWEKAHVDPLEMAGIDFVRLNEEEMKLKMDPGLQSPGHPPAMTLTTPGGSDLWEADFLVSYKAKVGKTATIGQEEQERSESDKVILGDDLLQKLILENPPSDPSADEPVQATQVPNGSLDHDPQDEAVAMEDVDIHSKSQADSAHAAAVGDDYDHVTAEVQLTLPRPKAKKVPEPEGVQSNFLEVQQQDGTKELSGSPELEAQVVDLVDQAVPEEEAVPDQDQEPEPDLSSGSKSEDPPSLCEHTTAPEIETIEVSDVDMEQEDEVEAEAAPPEPVPEEGEKKKKNGSPPVILTKVTSTAPGRRRAYGASGVRLLKVEAVDQHEQQKASEEAAAAHSNGSGDRSSSSSKRSGVSERDALIEEEFDDEENARMSSMFEVIGARSMDEALIKMETLEAVTRVMRLAGLESSNLIFGIDYTASNKYQGEISFGGDSLHKICDDRMNPYQQVITIMGQTLAPFAKGGYIPAYGFGDIRTSDTSIFPLKSSGYCKSFAEVLDVYNQITPKVILSGPTNFAPLIYQAIEICKEFKCYHILVIVADGQVTNERATRRAIVDACRYPLSIIVVGVGDGPWDMMRIFDEKLPKRPWDNFHFVEFYKVTAGAKQPDLAFAVQSLLEIPDQYKQIKALGLLEFC